MEGKGPRTSGEFPPPNHRYQGNTRLPTRQPNPTLIIRLACLSTGLNRHLKDIDSREELFGSGM
eukprot:1315539-Amorphochlora_amoeboformis.AAC.1